MLGWPPARFGVVFLAGVMEHEPHPNRCTSRSQSSAAAARRTIRAWTRPFGHGWRRSTPGASGIRWTCPVQGDDVADPNCRPHRPRSPRVRVRQRTRVARRRARRQLVAGEPSDRSASDLYLRGTSSMLPTAGTYEPPCSPPRALSGGGLDRDAGRQSTSMPVDPNRSAQGRNVAEGGDAANVARSARYVLTSSRRIVSQDRSWLSAD
jgi:hypothetical protein